MSKVSIEDIVRKYIIKAESVFREINISDSPSIVSRDAVRDVVDEAKRYLEDAKYYFERKKYEISLASIAYCEGLLDALRLLRLADFKW